jgi:CRISPR-associated protein Csd1
MILEELVNYYEYLKESGADIPVIGFGNQKIKYSLVIDSYGNFIRFEDIQDKSKKKPRPISIRVPLVKRTNGINKSPGFCWENLEYMFGIACDDTDWKITEKSKARFEAFREYHREHFKMINNDDLEAFIRFLDKWEPDVFLDLDIVLDDKCNNVVVKLLGNEKYLHESNELQRYWSDKYLSNCDCFGRCIISGDNTAIARLHPNIRVKGQSAPFVSFNMDSFCSYGNNSKDQGLNAPIGKYEAFAYSTAFNYISESKHKIELGDMTIVFWSEKKSKMDDIFGTLLNPSKDFDFVDEAEEFLDTVKKRRMPDYINGNERFFILGLVPNLSRLSVKFWHIDTIEGISNKLIQHFDFLDIVGRNEQYFMPSIKKLFSEIVFQYDEKNITSNIVGPFMMSILNGIPYPVSLMSLLIDRLKVIPKKNKDNKRQEHERINRYNCALIKAILNRNFNKEVSVSLDRERKDLPYNLGRLFAVLEKIQEKSEERKIKTTIKDNYFTSASVKPSVAFPKILHLSTHHQRKLKNKKYGLWVYYSKELGSIIYDNDIDKFPTYLSLEDQGLFVIGYYHQWNDFFVKKVDNENEEDRIDNEVVGEMKG